MSLTLRAVRNNHQTGRPITPSQLQRERTRKGSDAKMNVPVATVAQSRDRRSAKKEELVGPEVDEALLLSEPTSGRTAT